MLIGLQNKVAENKGALESLGGVWEKATSNNVYEALNALKGADIGGTHPGVGMARSKLEEATRLAENIGKAVHKGSDTSFLKKYMSLKRSPTGKQELQKFLANPQNLQRLNKMMSKDKLFKILDEGKMTTRQKLLGVSLGDTAKRLGLGTAAVAAGTALLKVYDWFSGHNPASKANEYSNLANQISKIGATGQGIGVAEEVRESLKKMESVSKEAEGLASEDKEEAKRSATEYVGRMTKEVDDINSALGNWNKVVEGSRDKELAIRLGGEVSQAVRDFRSELVDLAKTLGVSTNISRTPGVSGRTVTNKNDISEVQGLLGLPITGRLDRKTINNLRQLERQFNQKADTDEFTGAFVRSDGSIINPDNLVKAFNLIKQY